jgi:ubiquinone/menaquinone biosynthesis C-methylase UbiE
MEIDTQRHVDLLLKYVESKHPRSLKGVLEARAINPTRFDGYADRLLDWAIRALGPQAIAITTDAFVRFSMSVNFSQARYEAAGHYENNSYSECFNSVYNQKEAMDDYLWGVYLTNFMWSHHMDITMFFEDRFLAKQTPNAQLIEVAPGHGGWGLWALDCLPEARLRAFDISPSSIDIASSLARASGHQDRVSYELKDALDLGSAEPAVADGCICNFLIEHLEDPDKLLAAIARLLKPGARAFLSGALTAAQVDHIYEFRRESELVVMAERHGLRVLETLSVSPQRTLPRARFLPRSMSLILQKPTQGVW